MDCRHVRFSTAKSCVDFYQLQSLFQLAAFWAKERKLRDLKIAIKNSNPVVTAWDKKQMIGFARATSDGVYRATIWDVVIHPNYQGYGLGRKLVGTLISHPLLNQVERIYLMTSHQQEFYKRIGFSENTTTTMLLENGALDESLSILTDQLRVNSKEKQSVIG